MTMTETGAKSPTGENTDWKDQIGLSYTVPHHAWNALVCSAIQDGAQAHEVIGGHRVCDVQVQTSMNRGIQEMMGGYSTTRSEPVSEADAETATKAVDRSAMASERQIMVLRLETVSAPRTSSWAYTEKTFLK
jgi:hypothetical protein